MIRTRFCYTNPNTPAGKLCTIHIQGSKQAFLGCELDITEALGTVLHPVSYKSYIGYAAGGEEVANLAISHIKRKVSYVGGVGWFVGNWQ